MSINTDHSSFMFGRSVVKAITAEWIPRVLTPLSYQLLFQDLI